MTTTTAHRVRSAADLVATRCLVRGTSLCIPRRALWAAARLDDLAARLGRAAVRADRPDERRAPFEVRLRRTLARADDATTLLAAELLAVHLLFPADVTAARKRALVAGVLERLRDPPALPTTVGDAFEDGAAPAGPAYQLRRLSHLAWLAAAGAACQRVPARRRRATLADPAGVAAVLTGVEAAGGGPQRAALLHLLHPDVFAPVTSQRVRVTILRAFADLVPEGETDPDLALAAVRGALETTYGAGFSFFDPQVAARWR